MFPDFTQEEKALFHYSEGDHFLVPLLISVLTGLYAQEACGKDAFTAWAAALNEDSATRSQEQGLREPGWTGALQGPSGGGQRHSGN